MLSAEEVELHILLAGQNVVKRWTIIASGELVPYHKYVLVIVSVTGDDNPMG